jgi:hypothetical protein
MDAMLSQSADNNDARYGLATSSLPSSSAQSSQSSVISSGKMEKFLLLEALLSFLHSAVSCVCIIRFRMCVDLCFTYAWYRSERMWKLAVLSVSHVYGFLHWEAVSSYIALRFSLLPGYLLGIFCIYISSVASWLFFIYVWVWSGTKSTLIGAIYWPVVRAVDLIWWWLWNS